MGSTKSTYPSVYSIRWSAILTGSLLAVLGYFVFTSLGLAVEASLAATGPEGGLTAVGAVKGSGAWLLLVSLFSLALGGFAAARISPNQPRHFTVVQAGAISAFFFAFLLVQVNSGMALPGANRGPSAVDKNAIALSNPRLQTSVDRALAGIYLRAPRSVVAQNLGILMLESSDESAGLYLLRQSDLSPAAVDVRISVLRAEVDQVAQSVASDTILAAKMAAWMLFGAIVIGSSAAVLSAIYGAKINDRRREKAIEGEDYYPMAA